MIIVIVIDPVVVWYYLCCCLDSSLSFWKFTQLIGLSHSSYCLLYSCYCCCLFLTFFLLWSLLLFMLLHFIFFFLLLLLLCIFERLSLSLAHLSLFKNFLEQKLLKTRVWSLMCFEFMKFVLSFVVVIRFQKKKGCQFVSLKLCL